jgi:hypothetical protein
MPDSGHLIKRKDILLVLTGIVALSFSVGFSDLINGNKEGPDNCFII